MKLEISRQILTKNAQISNIKMKSEHN